MPGAHSFSSSARGASTFSRLQEVAVQRGRRIRQPVFVSAYVISKTALVNDVDATEN